MFFTRLAILSGSISLYLPAEHKLIAGDTLFKGSVGRTDLPGGDFSKISGSIRGKLYALPESTIVYPGHGETTDIGTEKTLESVCAGLSRALEFAHDAADGDLFGVGDGFRNPAGYPWLVCRAGA